jgi:hypothetical protein
MSQWSQTEARAQKLVSTGALEFSLRPNSRIPTTGIFVKTFVTYCHLPRVGYSAILYILVTCPFASLSVNGTQDKGLVCVVRTNCIYSFNPLKSSGHYIYRTLVTIYRTVVTIYTAEWSLYIPHSGHYMYRHFNIHNSTFCPHSVFMCFVWI